MARKWISKPIDLTSKVILLTLLVNGTPDLGRRFYLEGLWDANLVIWITWSRGQHKRKHRSTQLVRDKLSRQEALSHMTWRYGSTFLKSFVCSISVILLQQSNGSSFRSNIYVRVCQRWGDCPTCDICCPSYQLKESKIPVHYALRRSRPNLLTFKSILNFFATKT